MEKRKRIQRRICAGLCLLIAGVGGGFAGYGNSTAYHRAEFDKTYQGYMKNEGRNMLVFDPEPKTERTNAPQLRILGNPQRLGLEIGENYNLIIKGKKWNFLGEQLIKATPIEKE